MLFVRLQILKHLGSDPDCLQFPVTSVFQKARLGQDLEDG